jgi:two-component system, NtrC family, sensor histidine kinase HydH
VETPATEPASRTAAPAAIRRWERWLPRAIGAVAVVLSLFLAAMLWFVQRSVERASTALVQGEALELAGSVHDLLRSAEGRPTAADFGALLEEEWPRGLRYVALLGPDGARAEVQAGEPSGPLVETDPDLKPMEPVVVGDRVRVLTGPPVRREGRFRGPFGPPDGEPPFPDPGARAHADRPPTNGYFPGRPRGAPWDPPGGMGHPPHGAPGQPFEGGPPRFLGRGPPPRVLLEFVPVRAAELTQLAEQTSWLAMLAMPTFLGGALLLIQLVRQREDLSARLEHDRRLAALGEMTAVIAHEIRNPLASLKGHAQLLERSLGEDARRGKADLVVREAVRLQDLVADLLEFSRSGTLELRPSDPVAVLRESAEAIAPERIVLDVAGAPPTWRLDPARMRQVIGNVLRNAVQASPDDSPIHAAVFRDDGQLIFEVRDHGPGITPGDEERIFEPFYTRKTRGTGLGLPLVRRIVGQHGGTVRAGNHPEGGAVLRISLA